MGIELFKKVVNINGIFYQIKIWDTCGDEKYRAITRQYYKDAQGILLVYDITNKKSFEVFSYNRQYFLPCSLILHKAKEEQCSIQETA